MISPLISSPTIRLIALLLIAQLGLFSCDSGPSYAGLVTAGKAKLENPETRKDALVDFQKAMAIENTNEIQSLISQLQWSMMEAGELPMPAMVRVTGGSFLMGSNDGDGDETPIHSVKVSDFDLAIKEVSNAEYAVFLNAKGNQLEAESRWIDTESKDCMIEQTGNTFTALPKLADHPVNEISWFGAVAYCTWLSELSGQAYRLPTEAEWEYAAGGGENKRTLYSGTSNPKRASNFGNYMRADPYPNTAPCGSFEANALGIYDMSGNMREWVHDYYDKSYYGGSAGSTDPQGPAEARSRVNRGGSYGSSIEDLRIANREAGSPSMHKYYIGFRVARSVKE